MSEFKHTPEPWVVYKADKGIAYGIDSERKETVLYYKSKSDPQFTGLNGEPELANANAARIVACVNHCKGATNYELEATSHEQLVSTLEKELKGIGVLEAEIEKLKAQNKELLEIIEICYNAEKRRKSKLVFGSPASSYTQTRIDKIEAAIAKIKGGQQ